MTESHYSSIVLHCLDFDCWAVAGHDNFSRDAAVLGSQRQGLGVVAAAVGHHTQLPTSPLLVLLPGLLELLDSIGGSTDLHKEYTIGNQRIH